MGDVSRGLGDNAWWIGINVCGVVSATHGCHEYLLHYILGPYIIILHKGPIYYLAQGDIFYLLYLYLYIIRADDLLFRESNLLFCVSEGDTIIFVPRHGEAIGGT